MFFDDWDWKNHKPEKISKTILWEYDTESPEWNWDEKATIVVKRVFELGLPEDYWAMFQLYGGPDGVREIVKRIPSLEPRLVAFACVVFGLKRKELVCCQKKRLIQRPSKSWNA